MKTEVKLKPQISMEELEPTGCDLHIKWQTKRPWTQTVGETLLTKESGTFLRQILLEIALAL